MDRLKNKRFIFVFISVLGVSSIASAIENPKQPLVLDRACYVFKRPSLKSDKVCRRDKGHKISKFRDSGKHYVKVLTGKCMGYVPRKCFAAEQQNQSLPKTASVGQSQPLYDSLDLSILLLGDGLFGSISGASSSPSGLGYGAGLAGSILISDFRFAVQTGLVFQSLSRSLTASGVIADSVGTEFTTKVTFLDVAAFGAYRLIGHPSAGHGGIIGFIELGIESLFSLSATQSSVMTADVSDSAVGTALYVVLGPSITMPLSESLNLTAYLHGFYNLGAASGVTLFGVRVAVGIGISV